MVTHGLEGFTSDRCVMEISLEKLHHNYSEIKSCMPKGTRFMAVLKANAYGHGLVRIGQELEMYKDDWIAVASIDEALKLRWGGVEKDVLILGYTAPKYVDTLSQYNITQAIVSYEHGEALCLAAKSAGVRVKTHIAIDTGMSRFGLMAYGDDLENELNRAVRLYGAAGIDVTGIFTHFSSAYGVTEADVEYTQRQYRRFKSFCDALEASGISTGLRHCCNSPALINYPEFSMDMCRGGDILFGFVDSGIMKRNCSLETVASIKTIVALIKEVEENIPISYCRSAVSHRRTKLAVLSIGWYDGFVKEGERYASVLIKGSRYPVIGQICMDSSIADITGSNDINVGDEVVILGKQGAQEITWNEICRPLGIGPGRIGGRIGERVPRVY